MPFLHSTNSCISFNSIQFISVQVSVLAPKQRTKALSIHTEKPSSCPGSCGQGARPLTPTMAGGRDGGGTNLFKLRQEPWSQAKNRNWELQNKGLHYCIILSSILQVIANHFLCYNVMLENSIQNYESIIINFFKLFFSSTIFMVPVGVCFRDGLLRITFY